MKIIGCDLHARQQTTAMLDEGGTEAAVIKYNVFNRDGVYITNIFQKTGLFSLAEVAVDYFLKHHFSGRSYPEADNPEEILWALGQRWLFVRDENWLERIYPSAAKIASMIEYYRTTPVALGERYELDLRRSPSKRLTERTEGRPMRWVPSGVHTGVRHCWPAGCRRFSPGSGNASGRKKVVGIITNAIWSL